MKNGISECLDLPHREKYEAYHSDIQLAAHIHTDFAAMHLSLIRAAWEPRLMPTLSNYIQRRKPAEYSSKTQNRCRRAYFAEGEGTPKFTL